MLCLPSKCYLHPASYREPQDHVGLLLVALTAHPIIGLEVGILNQICWVRKDYHKQVTP